MILNENKTVCFHVRKPLFSQAYIDSIGLTMRSKSNKLGCFSVVGEVCSSKRNENTLNEGSVHTMDTSNTSIYYYYSFCKKS
jgi:hypothetical protein